MALLIGGVGLGFIFGYIIFWRRTVELENDLQEKESMLEAAVDMLAQERQQKKEWQEVGKKCGSGDLFGKW